MVNGEGVNPLRKCKRKEVYKMGKYTVQYTVRGKREVKHFTSIGYALQFARICAHKYGAFEVYDGAKLRLKKGHI